MSTIARPSLLLSQALSFCFISESLGDFPIDPFGKGGNDAVSQDYVPDEKYFYAKLMWDDKGTGILFEHCLVPVDTFWLIENSTFNLKMWTWAMCVISDVAIMVQYHSFIWKRSFLDTWQHHRVMPLHTQLIAIEMNPKLFLLSQIIHLFQNCVHSKKIVTFQYNFGHYEHFLPKFQILVV